MPDPVRASFAAAAALCGCLAASATVVARDDAGVLEFFLSQARRAEPPPAPPQPAPQPAPYYYQPARDFVPRITVGPSRDSIRRAPRKQVAEPKRPAPAPAPKLDPVKDPNWYLKDPTLRSGDIVVLADRILVFNGSGGSRHTRADFTSLKDARAVPPAERRRIAWMAGLAPAPELAAETTGSVRTKKRRSRSR